MRGNKQEVTELNSSVWSDQKFNILGIIEY